MSHPRYLESQVPWFWPTRRRCSKLGTPSPNHRQKNGQEREEKWQLIRIAVVCIRFRISETQEKVRREEFKLLTWEKYHRVSTFFHSSDPRVAIDRRKQKGLQFGRLWPPSTCFFGSTSPCKPYSNRGPRFADPPLLLPDSKPHQNRVDEHRRIPDIYIQIR